MYESRMFESGDRILANDFSLESEARADLALVMKFSRRNFLAASASVGAFSLVPSSIARDKHVTNEELEKAAGTPVLQLKGISSPVNVESIELLRKGKEHFVRVRSKDGAERSEERRVGKEC